MTPLIYRKTYCDFIWNSFPITANFPVKNIVTNGLFIRMSVEKVTIWNYLADTIKEMNKNE